MSIIFNDEDLANALAYYNGRITKEQLIKLYGSWNNPRLQEALKQAKDLVVEGQVATTRHGIVGMFTALDRKYINWHNLLKQQDELRFKHVIASHSPGVIYDMYERRAKTNLKFGEHFYEIKRNITGAIRLRMAIYGEDLVTATKAISNEINLQIDTIWQRLKDTGFSMEAMGDWYQLKNEQFDAFDRRQRFAALSVVSDFMSLCLQSI